MWRIQIYTWNAAQAVLLCGCYGHLGARLLIGGFRVHLCLRPSRRQVPGRSPKYGDLILGILICRRKHPRRPEGAFCTATLLQPELVSQASGPWDVIPPNQQDAAMQFAAIASVLAYVDCSWRSPQGIGLAPIHGLRHIRPRKRESSILNAIGACIIPVDPQHPFLMTGLATARN